MVDAISIFSQTSTHSGTIRGFVKFHQCDKNTQCKVTIDLSGFAEDKLRGIHIHNWGDTREGCTSACSHFNPYGKLHGSEILYGTDRHVGDMINNIQSRSGKVYLEYFDNLIDLLAPVEQNIIGRMIVIHEDTDNLGFDRDIDQESATTGKAGKRIACAPIVLYNGK
jgi:Cu-Zn family superoxide dismutase